MNQFYKNLSLWLVIVLMMVMLYNIFNQQTGTYQEIGYSEFLAMVQDQRVDSVLIQGQELFITDVNDNKHKSYAPDDAQLIEMLRTEGGATIDEIVEATNWQAHTARGAMSGALKKKLGLTITSEKVDGRGRCYRIEDAD